MASRRCWKCGDTAVMVPKGRYGFDVENDEYHHDYVMAATLYACPGCRMPSVGLAPADSKGDDSLQRAGSGFQIMWLPEAATGRDFPDVPDHIASAADEAYRCRSFNALRASVLVCRSVIEATAKESGITSGTLYSKIDAMETAQLIRPHIKEAAHEIRLLGNDMAHGDFVEQIEPEEADEILELMAEVLAEVFQSPAKIARRRRDREAKSSVTAAP